MKLRITIQDKEHCKNVQLRLFELGYSWSNRPSNPIIYLNSEILYTWENMEIRRYPEYRWSIESIIESASNSKEEFRDTTLLDLYTSYIVDGHTLED